MITKYKLFDKLFENLLPEVGDLVEIKLIPMYASVIDSGNLYAKIVKIEKNQDERYQAPAFQAIKFELTNGQFLWGNRYLIRKWLNQKQIKDYELKVAANKYNI